MAKRKPDPRATPTLPGTTFRESQGTIERAAAADIKALRALDLIGPGLEGLATAYRRAARYVDRAERTHDTWGAMAAIRELRSVRLELAPVTSGLADDDLEQLLDQVVTILQRDTIR